MNPKYITVQCPDHQHLGRLCVNFHVMTAKPYVLPNRKPNANMKCRFNFSNHGLNVTFFARYKKMGVVSKLYDR